MKKKMIITVISVIAALVLIGGGTFAYASNVAKKNSISRETAIAVAMTDACLREEDVTVQKAHIDFEHGVFVYEIELLANNQIEYDYKIKASDGTILERDEEFDDDLPAVSQEVNQTANSSAKTTANAVNTTVPQDQASQSTADSETVNPASSQTTGNAKSNISLNEAKNIALRDAGVSEKNADFLKAEKDYDDGTSHFDIEFRTVDYEYDYEISLNGKILSKDREMLYRSAKTTHKHNSASAKYIGINKAKTIALAHASLTAEQVRFTKAKLDRDDGMDLYEIEFLCNGMEYEYEINARTGAVYSYSSERDD